MDMVLVQKSMLCPKIKVITTEVYVIDKQHTIEALWHNLYLITSVVCGLEGPNAY